MSTSPRRQSTTAPCARYCRRASRIYWYLAFPLLVLLGMRSIHNVERAISLGNISNDSHANPIAQPLIPSKQKGLPGFHNRDARFAKLFEADQQQQQQQSAATSKKSPSSNAVPGQSSNRLQQSSSNNNWWGTLQQHRQDQSLQTISRLNHPEFMEHLKQSRQALESKAVSALGVQMAPSFWKPAPTPVNQSIAFGDCFLPPPLLPQTSSSSVVVLVLSAHHNYERRQAIRETWAYHRTVPVYFVVGHSPCNTTTDCIQEDHNLLLHEQDTYHDLVEIPMVESYQRLPEKVVQAYHWTIQHIPSVQWIVKADDDTFVRLTNIWHYLGKYNSATPLWIGKMIPHSRVARKGKWADTEYRESDFYPYWAIGSAGHVVSRAIADFVVQNSATLHRYQGEDVSLGIWLHQWQQEQHVMVTYIQAKNLITNDGIGVCGISRYLMIGHDLTLDEMYECHLRFVNKTAFFENTWIEEPAAFADFVEMEEGKEPGASAAAAMLRNQVGVVAGGTNDSRGSAYDAAKAILGYDVPRGRSIGYQFPGSLRDHLAKAEKPNNN